MPKISVIVPVFNVERYIHRCVDSILNQTFTDFELILVDDGSPDNCGAICDEYAAKDARIRVLHKENGGVSSARNAALDIATGIYIVFVDSDDTISANYLEELVRWQEYDFVTAGYSWQDSYGNWNILEFAESDAVVADIRAYPSQYVGKYYFGSPWATLMRRELIEEHKLRFDTSVHSGEDTLFILTYMRHASTIKILPQCGYFYHYYPTSLINSLHKDLWKWRIVVEQRFSELFCAATGSEAVFLIERAWGVLMGLIERYDQSGYPDILRLIYTHPFFEPCIHHKKKYGSIRDKLLVYTMEHADYTRFKKLGRYLDIMSRIKHGLQKYLVGEKL